MLASMLWAQVSLLHEIYELQGIYSYLGVQVFGRQIYLEDIELLQILKLGFAG